jgi:hypothetical protein
MAKLVGSLLASAALWVQFKSRHISKIPIRRHKQRSGQLSQARQKNIQKSIMSNYIILNKITKLCIANERRNEGERNSGIRVLLTYILRNCYFYLCKKREISSICLVFHTSFALSLHCTFVATRIYIPTICGKNGI